MFIFRKGNHYFISAETNFFMSESKMYGKLRSNNIIAKEQVKKKNQMTGT